MLLQITEKKTEIVIILTKPESGQILLNSGLFLKYKVASLKFVNNVLRVI